MQIRKYIKVGLLPLLTLPLMGESCTEEKVVSLSVGVDTTAEFIAQGSENWHDDTDVIDVKEQTDLADVLDDNDIDPNDVESIKVSRVFYKITVPDPVAGREIVDGDVAIERVGVQTSSIISNFSGPADAVTDWIEVTRPLECRRRHHRKRLPRGVSRPSCRPELRRGARCSSTTSTGSASPRARTRTSSGRSR